MNRTLPFFAVFALHSSLFGADPLPALPEVPARVFLADVRLSFPLPDPWTLIEKKGTLPILQRKTAEERQAYIRSEVAPQVNSDRMSEDVAVDTLKEFARRDILARDPETRVLATEMRTLLGRNVYEVTWQQGPSNDTSLMHQSLFFYVQDRFVIVSLNSSRVDFPGLVPDFQTWVGTLRVLSQRQAGALDAPSRGGLYLNLGGRIRVPIPDSWLIGVANDRTFGAAIVQDEKEVSWTLTAEPRRADATLNDRARREARASLTRRDLRIQNSHEDAFHGYAALTLAFDGNKNGRFVKGQDIWVWSPGALWLISIEGDGPLVNRLQDDLRKMMDATEFL